MRKAIVILFFSLPWYLSCLAQETMYHEIKNTEISIPSSPAFALLGVNPEFVMRPSDLKSFKVDWRIKNYNLAPDLAIQAQPLWHFYFNKRPFDEYAKATQLIKKLSTLSVSAGTAKIDNVNHAAYSFKINLFKKNDIVSDVKFLDQIRRMYKDKLDSFNKQNDSLVLLRYKTTNPKRKEEIEDELELLRSEEDVIHVSAREKYQSLVDQYNASHWNNSMIDLAFGSVYTYDNTGKDSFKIQRAGYAIWLNGCLKAGNNGLLSGIVRYTKIGDSSNKQVGMSYRYGSFKYNFYVELVYENLGNYFNPNEDVPFDNDEYFEDKFIEDLGSGWLDFNNSSTRNQYTISYGGDFKLNKNILLNFALRTQFSEKIEFTKLLPVANVICLMK